MNRKLVLAMAAALALAVGCGDEDEPASGGMCTAETAATDCTASGNYQGCCTATGTCGVSLTSVCQPSCGAFPCVAGAAGNVCCDEATGLCGTAEGEACTVQPETAQCLVGGVDTTCPKVGSSPGCCLMDATTGTASCGAFLDGACAATTAVQAAIAPGSGGVVSGDGGTTLTDGSTDSGPAPSSVMCGTLTCAGQALPGIGSLNGCCTTTGACGLDATAYGFTCDTPTNLLTALAGSQGDGGAGTDGGGLTDSGVQIDGSVVTDGGQANCGAFTYEIFPGVNVSGCCFDTGNGTGKCGFDIGGTGCMEDTSGTIPADITCTP